MTAKPLPRPRQVSFSGWSIIVGSVLTILFAFQRVSDLGSLEAQQAAADFISNPPGDGLGLTVDDVQTAIRVMCFIAAGTAAATAILGWQALQRSRSARVVLSFLAPVLFVAGLTSGGLFSALVAAGVVMLWAQPARDWFNGKEQAPQPPLEPLLRRKSKATSDPESTAGSTAGSTAPATAESNPYGVPPAAGAHRAVGATGRPTRVTAAVVITIVASTVALAGLLLSLAFLVGSRETFLVEIEGQMAGNPAYDDIAADAVATVALVFLVLLSVWCLVSIALAIATLRGSNGARIALVVSAALSGLVSLLGLVVIVPLLLTAASVATVVLLLSSDAAEWCARRGR